MNSQDIESSDILRLIQHHLTECGLHESCRMLREESGVGAMATFSNLRSLAMSGRWGEVLSALSILDRRKNLLSPDLLADVHEMTILELAEVGEVEIAYAALRLVSTDEIGNKFSSIERRIQAADSIRKQEQHAGLPIDYYGKDNVSRQRRRDDIAKRLAESIPMAPRGRLLTLLQQSVKWQAHTGQLPMMERTNNDDEKNDSTGNGTEKKKKSKRKRHRSSTFDLVLGDAAIPSSKYSTKGSKSSDSSIPAEKIPTREAGKIKFGTKTQPECAIFLQDGSGLVTGSSDGFIEVWDPKKWGKLRTSDLPYQKMEEFMLHDSSVLALAISNDGEMLATGSSDGMVKIWKITNGKCLRIFPNAHAKAISALAFSRDGSHVLTASQDFLCREFGLRASRMLKQFQGHTSYVNTCAYVYDCHNVASSNILVVTASADATVRVWDGKTSEMKHVIRPFQSTDPTNHSIGTISMSGGGTTEDGGMGRNIHTVLHLHHPENTMIVVSRGSKAFLMNYSGAILRTYERSDKIEGVNLSIGTDFVSATISPSNKWLYIATEDRLCLCFDVNSGSVEYTMTLNDSNEVTGLVHHPHAGVLASFDNHKSTPGLLKVWK